MASTIADRLWAEFQALPAEARESFLELLVEDQPTRDDLEDLLDLALADERSAEPTRALEDVLREIGV
jgi:hypothetical protein